MSKYRIVQGPGTKKYKVQKKGWFLWRDIGLNKFYGLEFGFETLWFVTLEEAEKCVENMKKKDAIRALPKKTIKEIP